MKKIVAVIMILALSLTMLASCKSDKPGKANPDATLPEIKVTEEAKEFKNAEGKVAYKVSYSIPEFTAENCEQYVADFLNKYIAEFYLDKAFHFAEINVQHFRAEETAPREIKISHEIKYHSDYIVSIVFTTAYSQKSKIVEARTFNLTDGSVIGIEEYFLINKPDAQAALIEQLKETARYSFTDTELTEDHLKNIEEKFDRINFWVEDTGITFVYDKTDITPGIGATAGIFELPVDWSIAGAIGLATSPDYVFVNEQETVTQ